MSDELLDDMEADAAAALEEYDGEKIDTIAKKAHAVDAEIRDLEHQVAQKKRELKVLMEHVLPLRMNEIGIPEIGVKLDDGSSARIVLETKIVGSLSGAADQDKAVAYLEQEGFSAAVKTILSSEFSEDERDKAWQALKICEEDLGRTFSLKREINPQTLMAFGRRRLKENPAFDFELVGLRAWPQCKFTKR